MPRTKGHLTRLAPPALVLPLLAWAPLAEAQTLPSRPAFRLDCILRQFLQTPAVGHPAGSGLARPVKLPAHGLQPARALAPGWPVQPRRAHPRPELKTQVRPVSTRASIQETKASRTAAAAEAWGAPVHLGTSEASLNQPPQVVLNARNQGLAVWEQAYQGTNRVFGASWRAEPGQAEGQWQEAACLSGLEEASRPQVALNDAGAGMAVWSGQDGVWAAPFGASAGWGEPVRLSKAGGLPRVGIDAAGNALAVWKDGHLRGGRTDFLVASRYEPETGWDAPVKLIDGPLFVWADLRMAMTPGGKALVTCLDPAKAAAWARSFDPVRGWGEPVKLFEGRCGGNSPSNLEPAIGPGGRAVVAWRETFKVPVLGPVGPSIREVPQLVIQDLLASQATRLDRGAQGPCRVAMDDSDRAFAVWHSGSGGLKAARFEDGEAEAAVELGIPGEPAPIGPDFGAAVAPGGMAMAVYGQATGGATRESAWSQCYLPPEAAGSRGGKPGWQPAVLVSSGDGGGIRLPAVAMNDRGVALALWERAVGDGRVRIEAVAWSRPGGQ